MNKELKNYNPMLMTDFYKVSHKALYPQGTQKIYSTFTPRGSRVTGVDEVVMFGLQKFIKEYLVEYFNENFFGLSKSEVLEDYRRVIKYTLGIENPDVNHIGELHDLGYLPIKVKALKEGTLIPLRIPCLTIENTIDKFFWITNFLETLISCELWQPMTSATTSLQYRKIVEGYSKETCDNNDHILFQCHDFSARGMSCMYSAISSGMGHLLSFCGTDTIPAITGMEKFYNANIENELVGTSIPATEHSIACSYGKDNEFEYYRHIIEDVHPNGLVSLVSDTWSLWNVLTNIIPNLKDKILARDGKVVIRPDSGNPADIICGDINGKTKIEQQGVVEYLWELFGGTINSKGYKVLDSHIGAIYGDSITLERANEICKRLKEKGFASSNIVLGVGSFSYQYVTRDTYCFAMKATYAVVNGEERKLFKDPITDDGTKKSQKGIVAVIDAFGKPRLVDDLDEETYNKSYKDLDLLEVVYEDGKLIREESLSEIRERLSRIL